MNQTYLTNDESGEPILVETIRFTEADGTEAVQLQERRVTVDEETGEPVVYRGFGNVVRGGDVVALDGLTETGDDAALLAAWQAWSAVKG